MPIVSVDYFLSAKLDYLIVGGGTAGLVVAARLTEDPTCVVGVIEAGEFHNEDPAVDVPGLLGRNLGNPKYDWCFNTIPQKYVNNRMIWQPRGKGLGGCSMVNFMTFVRPSKDELDTFERLGNPGWNWSSLLFYMKKSEHLEPLDLSLEQSQELALQLDPAFHGTDGPIAKSFPLSNITEVHPKSIVALERLGLPRILDGANGKTVGCMAPPKSVVAKTATRSYSASAYYLPNAKRSNLLVLTGAHVTKINFVQNADGLQRALGVDFIKDSIKRTVSARTEVILAAGSVQTPQLLELSGIGNESILKALGVETVVDLPGVGENLQDHMYAPTIVEVDKSFPSADALWEPQELERQWLLYKEQKGILASAATTFTAFIPATLLADENEVVRWAPNNTTESTSNTPASVRQGIVKQHALMRGWLKDPDHPVGQLLNANGHFPVPGLKSNSQKRYTSFLCACTNPFSRGSIHISSKDPMEAPIIDPNYLSNPMDREILAHMVKFTTRLFQTEPLAEVVVAPVAPKFDANEVDSDTLADYVRNTLDTIFHPVGTASMLPREDGGVVDSQLKVYGTSNLRIVDCSIIPLQVSCNIQALCYGIAEKAADIIKGVPNGHCQKIRVDGERDRV